MSEPSDFEDAAGQAAVEQWREELHRMYTVFIEYIRHENELVSQRLGRFITLQSFLFATTGLVLQGATSVNSAVSSNGTALAIYLLLAPVVFTCICVIGFISSVTTFVAVKSARHSQDRTNKLWISFPTQKNSLSVMAKQKGYPALMGGGEQEGLRYFADRNSASFSLVMPCALALFWVSLVFFFTVSLWPYWR